MKTILSVLILIFSVTSFAGGASKATSSRKPASAADIPENSPYPVHMNASCRYIPKSQVRNTALQSPGISASKTYGHEALFCSVDIEPAMQLQGQGAPAAAKGHPAVPVPKKEDAECNLILREESEKSPGLNGFVHSCSTERYAFSVYDDENTKNKKDDVIFFCCVTSNNY